MAQSFLGYGFFLLNPVFCLTLSPFWGSVSLPGSTWLGHWTVRVQQFSAFRPSEPISGWGIGAHGNSILDALGCSVVLLL